MPPAERKTGNLSALLGQQTELDKIGAEILNAGPRAIRYRETSARGKSMVFVAQRGDVVRVLTDEADFSLCHYTPLYAAIAPPRACIIMRPEGAERAERMAILKTAAARTPWFGPDPTARHDVARACVDNVLAAVKGRRPFDLIGEYGFFVPYLVGKRVLGLAGPRSFSLLALAICLVNGHPLIQLIEPETGPYLTDLAWSEFIVAQILKNFENRSWILRTLGRCGASLLRNQSEAYIDAFPRTAGDQTLLHALWAVRRDFPKLKDGVYREHVVSIMMEVAATLLLVPGSGFTGIVDRWLKGPGLEDSLRPLRALGSIAAEDFVQEQLRIAPPDPQLLRNATRQIDLGGLTLEKGEYVCALVKSAGADVPDPGQVVTGRPPNTYVHFGPVGGPHRCFGHLLAPALLAEMFLGLTRLPDLAPRSGLTGRFGLVPGRLMVDFGEPLVLP